MFDTATPTWLPSYDPRKPVAQGPLHAPMVYLPRADTCVPPGTTKCRTSAHAHLRRQFIKEHDGYSHFLTKSVDPSREGRLSKIKVADIRSSTER